MTNEELINHIDNAIANYNDAIRNNRAAGNVGNVHDEPMSFRELIIAGEAARRAYVNIRDAIT
jgi:hypothetical protein